MCCAREKWRHNDKNRKVVTLLRRLLQAWGEYEREGTKPFPLVEELAGLLPGGDIPGRPDLGGIIDDVLHFPVDRRDVGPEVERDPVSLLVQSLLHDRVLPSAY